jgi:hypothetical protein
VDRIKRFDPCRQAATYWNRWKEAGLNCLILSTRLPFDPAHPPPKKRHTHRIEPSDTQTGHIMCYRYS